MVSNLVNLLFFSMETEIIWVSYKYPSTFDLHGMFSHNDVEIKPPPTHQTVKAPSQTANELSTEPRVVFKKFYRWVQVHSIDKHI